MFSLRSQDDIPKKGAVRAVLAVAYVVAVASLMTLLERTTNEGELGMLAPVGFLLMFTLSAAVMASLVFGTPVQLYLDGKKHESVRLVGWTIGWLAMVTVGILLSMLVR
jgi:hypothetical protein